MDIEEVGLDIALVKVFVEIVLKEGPELIC